MSSRPVTTLYMANVLVMALAMLGLALAASFAELAVLVCILSFTNSCVTISYSQLLRYEPTELALLIFTVVTCYVRLVL